jgi:hypothetical protein
MHADSTAPTSSRPIDVPWELNVPVADLYLVGYGMHLPNDLTLETVAILKRCKRLFGLPPINATAFGIPAMESIAVPDTPDDEIVTLVLDAAADGPVAFATFGNPMADTPQAHRLVEEAPGRGLTVHVANAVSSLDVIWAKLNIDPFLGCQIWGANDLVLSEAVPDTKTTLLVPPAPANRGKLPDYLLRFYPPDHVVHLVAAGPDADSVVTAVCLGELAAAARHASSTLVVPAR